MGQEQQTKRDAKDKHSVRRCARIDNHVRPSIAIIEPRGTAVACWEIQQRSYFTS